MIGQAGDRTDDIVLAGELALGLLEGEDRRAATHRMYTEHSFAQLVRDWSEHFAQLHDAVETVPPVALKGRVEAHVFGRPTRRRRWALPGLLGAAAVAISALVFLPDALFGPLEPTFTTDLASADGVFLIHFGYIAEDQRLLVRRDAGQVPAGRDQEFWLIPLGGAPISMGTITDDGSVNAYAVTPAILDILPGATLAVSDEPDGGSPTGQPTGEIVVAGPVPAY